MHAIETPINRRSLTAGAAALTALGVFRPARASAVRVVYLWLGAAGSDGSTREGLEAGLAKLGYRLGSDILIEFLYADGSQARLEELAATAVWSNPDLILAPGTIVTGIVKRLTATIPIVSTTPDPVGSGFIANLAHPGGNITGATIMAGPEIAEKWLELAAELLSGLDRVAVLMNPENVASRTYLERMRAVAGRIGRGLRLMVSEVRAPDDFERCFAEIASYEAEALICDIDVLTVSKRAVVARLTAEQRLPAVYGLRDFVEAGGLIAYGASVFEIWKSAAVYIDKILNGAKPADLPVQQPTTFELAINLKAATALTLNIPPSVLARATYIIE